MLDFEFVSLFNNFMVITPDKQKQGNYIEYLMFNNP